MGEELTRQVKQRNTSLARAMEVRSLRAQLREDCKERKVDAIALVRGDLEDLEPLIAKWRLEQLIPLVPGVGSVTMGEIFSVGKFSPRQLVSSLPPDRRAQLARLCKQGGSNNPAKRLRPEQ